MDEGTPKEVDETNWEHWSGEWEKWYLKYRDAVIEARATTDVLQELVGHSPQSSNIVSRLMFALANSLDVSRAILDTQNKLRQGILENVRTITTLRERLDKNVTDTEMTLKAINKFVEHYTPLLEELEEERPQQRKIGS